MREITGGANETISALIRKYQRQAFFASFKDSMPQSFQELIIKAGQELYQDFESKWTADRSALQDQFDQKEEEIDQLLREAEARAETAEKRAEIAEKCRREIEEENAQLRTQNLRLAVGIAAQSDNHNQQREKELAMLAKISQMLESRTSAQEPEAKKNIA